MRIITTLALLGLSSAAFAGVTMQMEARELAEPNEKPDVQIWSFQDGAFRIEQPQANEINLFRDQVMYAIDTKKKTYRRIDKAQMDQLGKQLAGMRTQMDAQMAKLPPEQRAAMEQMMGKTAAVKKLPVVSVRDSGRGETVAGYACRIWEVLSDGKKETEVCAAPPASIPGGADLLKSMREIGTFTSGLSEVMGGKNSANNYWSQLMQINGVPILTREFDDKGKPDSETRAVAIKSNSLPAALFTVPAGFTEKKTPMIGGDDDDP